ncbi:lipopolysaccharide assembly protein LapA domain-containing protein [Corynebacterium sp. 153RC1]|uniref:LapA family protein n=2 Tax=unclassified Corynebacterium TaxID=2624378 RepID=UPI00211BD591|nr:MULTISPECIES: lipopolysaccharide assembly protein LapA domain-containing protein [unclassified Corynebacterium]MCQ9371456.1 lipopolysaccharide assembly protein LapA domain-containing protein [Corynebacterium sp. 35RC1]MCQ9351627.1 lipopolysaccharide assembly protein LapA domain-containing protein [Corynebacterium sp. 209RC1]MCQ9353996.1 lipopolysaccharide assembly protein LapA domain-containing protein [Corynebacterium sp. 1222RC1]MCQ9355910.1 lipopolysaccharide assembly protein LapA domain-
MVAMTNNQNADFADQTHPDFQASTVPAVQEPAVPAASTEPKVKSSFAGGTWVALIVGALLLIALLVFILQNQQQVELTMFAWAFTVPAGVGFLLAAILGALIMAMVGIVRMYQLRRQIKKANKR